MKSFKLLMDTDCADPIAVLCSVLGAESNIVDSASVRRSANLRLFQIDIPDVPARVLAETARQAGVSMETLLMDWISQAGREAAQGAGAPQRILSKCRRIADWCALGYTNQTEEIGFLAARLMKD